MDHLPYPQHPAVATPDVPYLCSAPYDCGDFQTYPERSGWESTLICWQQLFPGTCKHVVCAERLPFLEDFVQRWLFFGLLHNFLGSGYSETDFTVELRPETQVVRTVALVAKLNKCIESGSTKDDHKIELLRWQHDLESVSRVLQRFFVAAKQLYKQPNHANDDLAQRTGGVIRHWVVWQSILCLGETLTFYLHSLNGDDTGLETRWRTLCVGMDEVLGGNSYATTMMRNGWCISRASRLCQQSSTLSKLHFFSGLQSPDTPELHARCSALMCLRSQIDTETYSPAECTGCSCGLVGHGEDHGKIAAILGSGALPVLRIEGQNTKKVTVRIEAAGETKQYVALSHVWADGLGNPTAMEIHGCQLLRLRDMVARLEGTEIFEDKAIGTDELLLWLDTLCVPPYKQDMSEEYEHARDSAMERMWDVYSEAAYVLILDASLIPFALNDIGAVEAALRLIQSPWMERLWTMQEVLLAKKPLLMFKDKAVDLRVLWRDAKEICARSWLLHSMHVEVDYQIRRLRVLMSGEELTTAQRTVQICSMVAQRRVTVSSDEAICLCNTLALSMTELLKAPKQERMQKFWELLGNMPKGIPSNIVMLDFKRLATPGYRWAPRSLLGSSSSFSSHSSGSQIMAALDKPEWSTQLMPEGLAVRFAGWRTARAAKSSLLTAQEQNWCDEYLSGFSAKSMHVRDLEGAWHRMTTGKGTFVNNKLTSLDALPSSFTLLRDPTSGANLDFKALQVKPERERGGITIVEPLTHVLLQKEAENEQILWIAAYAKAMELISAGTVPSSLRFVASQRPEHANDPILSASQVEGRWWFELDVDGNTELAQHYSRTAVPVFDFAMRVLALFVGRYFVVKKSYPENTMWCIR